MSEAHGNAAPSDWVQRWAPLVPDAARVLDVACGTGRHARHFAERGHAVTAVDRDAGALASLPPTVTARLADLEGAPWPLPGETFGGVVVTNYLWRPLWPALLRSLEPGGVLICETFAVGQAVYGRPTNPDFLLRAGELLELCRGLQIVAYEDGVLDGPPRRVQRIAAVHAPAQGAAHRLEPGAGA